MWYRKIQRRDGLTNVAKRWLGGETQRKTGQMAKFF